MGPTLKAQQKFVFLPLFLCFACISLEAQQQDGAQALYSKAGQTPAGLLIAGKSQAHARQSMHHTRSEMSKFRRYFWRH